jgi:hypothetical protein
MSSSTVAAYPNSEISSRSFRFPIHAVLTSAVTRDFLSGALLVGILMVLCMVPA